MHRDLRVLRYLRNFPFLVGCCLNSLEGAGKKAHSQIYNRLERTPLVCSFGKLSPFDNAAQHSFGSGLSIKNNPMNVPHIYINSSLFTIYNLLSNSSFLQHTRHHIKMAKLYQIGKLNSLQKRMTGVASVHMKHLNQKRTCLDYYERVECDEGAKQTWFVSSKGVECQTTSL
jgi:hypothetical protein